MTQVRTDPATWQWSDNAALVILDYLMSPDAGMGIPWEWIEPNLAGFKTAADICDERVISPAAGGSEPRYRIWGTYSFDMKPADILAAFRRQCDGRVWIKADGSVGLSVGRFVPPTVTIPAKHVIAYDMSRGQDRLTAVAGLRAQYLEPENNYQETDAEPWPDGNTVMELGEDRVATLDLTMSPSFGQARRLMKRNFIRATSPWTGTVTTTLYGLKALDERTIAIEFDDIGQTLTFEVDKLVIDDENNQCQLTVTAVDASIDDWDPLTEEGTPAGIPVSTAWTAALSSTFDYGGAAGTTTTDRMVIRSADTNAGGTAIRLTLSNLAGAGATIFDHVAIVPRSGSGPNGTTTPSEVTFGGTSGVTINPGESVVSDWIAFTLDKSVDHLVIIDESTGSGGISYGQNSNYVDYNLSPGASWNVVNMPVGYTTTSGVGTPLWSLTKIEVRG